MEIWRKIIREIVKSMENHEENGIKVVRNYHRNGEIDKK